jgi:hypothetical protein
MARLSAVCLLILLVACAAVVPSQAYTVMKSQPMTWWTPANNDYSVGGYPSASPGTIAGPSPMNYNYGSMPYPLPHGGTPPWVQQYHQVPGQGPESNMWD